MPVNRRYPIATVLEAVADFARTTGTETWVNYMVFKGFNDTLEDATALIELLAPHVGTLKLMTTIPNRDLPLYKAADSASMEQFEQLLKEKGLINEQRRFVSSGAEIEAGCGQFAFFSSRKSD